MLLEEARGAERCVKDRLGKLMIGILHILEVSIRENTLGQAPNIICTACIVYNVLCTLYSTIFRYMHNYCVYCIVCSTVQYNI